MEELLTRYPALKSCAGEIGKTAEILISGFKADNKLMLCGNGGDVLSKLQLAVPAIPLPSLTALNSAFCNDVDPSLVYAQELMGLGTPGICCFA